MSDRTKWLQELSGRLNIKNVEEPTDEWFTTYDMVKSTGYSEDAIRRKLNKSSNLEKKKFLINGNWLSYYREKPTCQGKQSKSSKESLEKSKPSVCRMVVKLK